MTGGNPADRALPSDELLSESESQNIFRTRIVRHMLEGFQPQDAPFLLVLSAQAGAGKGTWARAWQASLPRDIRPVHVEVDSFKPFHPRYVDLQAQYDPQTADDLVHLDARRWLDQALGYIRDHRLSAIAEHGLRNPQVIDALLEPFHEAGYEIRTALMAVSLAESQQSVLERFQTGFERAGIARPVPEELQRGRYSQLEQVAGWLQADPRVSELGIYTRRSLDPVYLVRRTDAAIDNSSQTATQALIAERERPLPLKESQRFLRHHHSLHARLPREKIPELDRSLAAARAILHPDAGIPTHDRPAVTFGRYQIVSIAHLDTVRTILLDWPSLEIGILDLEAKPGSSLPVPEHLSEFYRDCEANTAPAKNPFSAAQRAEFWKATIEAVGLQGRVSVRIIQRPELDPSGFRKLYPPDQVDLVFPTTRGAGFDAIRNRCFEEILARPVHHVDPPLEYHTSDIKRAYQAGNPAWKHGLAPGCLEAFIAAGGPQRLLGKIESPSITASQTSVTAAAAAQHSVTGKSHGRQSPQPAPLDQSAAPRQTRPTRDPRHGR